jgi:hypothetical protein
MLFILISELFFNKSFKFISSSIFELPVLKEIKLFSLQLLFISTQFSCFKIFSILNISELDKLFISTQFSFSSLIFSLLLFSAIFSVISSIVSQDISFSIFLSGCSFSVIELISTPSASIIFSESFSIFTLSFSNTQDNVSAQN